MILPRLSSFRRFYSLSRCTYNTSLLLRIFSETPERCHKPCSISRRILDLQGFLLPRPQYPAMRSMSNIKVEDLLNDPARHLSHDAMMRKKEDGFLLIIDVREPGEISSSGVVPGSVNIPLMNIEDALGGMTPEAFRRTYGVEKPTKATMIVFSCRSGKRSKTALTRALSLGYLNSCHYEGGWLEWEKHLPRNR